MNPVCTCLLKSLVDIWQINVNHNLYPSDSGLRILGAVFQGGGDADV
jgi:hypothetical protein